MSGGSPVGLSNETAALIAANPFPGLRSFKPTESDRFFGRQQQVNALRDRLAQVPLVAVSGASGCGKSSLVLAGLLNTLAQDELGDGSPAWRTAVLRPGNRPIAALAAALAAGLPAPASSAAAPVDDDRTVLRPAAAEAPTPPAAAPGGDAPPDDNPFEDLSPQARRVASLHGQLRLGGLGLVEVVRAARLPPGMRLLVVVDQFEEIFRFRRMADPDEARAFVKLLLQAAADPTSRVKVIITLRSDTLGSCADFPDLPEAVSAGSYLVPRLSRNQRKEAINGPVALRGARIAPRLVQRLLADVSADFDDLPVLQHVLQRTWQHWAESGGGRDIDLPDYEATGGAAQALSHHADEACQSLGPLGAPGGTVERVFRALTEQVAEGTEVRRPIEFNQLCLIAGDGSPAGSAAVTQVVERFRRNDTAFLVPGADVPLAGNPVIDISHESLIRQWQRLRGWVRDEADAAAELHRLVDDAQAQASAAGELWRGRNLERAREWQQRHHPNAAWVRLCTGGSDAEAAQRLATVTGFLTQSEQAQAQEQQRQRWQRRGLGALVALVLLVSVGAAITGLTLQRQARSRELSTRAILELAQDPARSARLALMALDQDGGNPRGEFALRQALATLEVAQAEQIVAFNEPIVEARYTSDKQQILVAGGKTVWLLAADTLAVQAQLQAPEAVRQAWRLGPHIIAVGQEGRAWLLAMDGKLVADLSCRAPDDIATSAAYHAASAAGVKTGGAAGPATAVAGNAAGPAAAQLAVGCMSGELSLWRLDEPGQPARQLLIAAGADSSEITALGFSADGAWLASGDLVGRSLVWKRGLTSRAWIGDARPGGPSPLTHRGSVEDISFNPNDPALLATASEDGTASVWTLDLARGEVIPANTGGHVDIRLSHERKVAVARFVDRADDPNRLMTVTDQRVFFWSDDRNHDERKHDDWVVEASVSADGEYLVSASSDGTARVWSSRTTVPVAVLRGHRNEVTHALFGPAGRILTASRDGTVRAWRLAPPRLLAAGKTWQTVAALSPSSGQAVLCGEPDSSGATCRQAALAGGAPREAADSAVLATGRRSRVEAVSLSPDGTLLLTKQATIGALWDVASRRRLPRPWLNFVEQLRFHPTQAEWAWLKPDGSLQVWPQAALRSTEPPAGTPLAALPAKAGRSQVALSPDSRWIAADDGNQVALWDRRAPGAAPLRLAGHNGRLRALAFSPDSGALASASTDRTARIWSLKGLAAGQVPPSVVLEGHSAALSSVAFSPDGQRVVTGSADNSVRVWQASTGREWATLFRHDGAVNDVLFDASGEQVLSLSQDGTAVLGRCDACRLPLPMLTERARAVPLAPGELASLDGGPAASLLGIPLPRWLGGGR